MGRGPTVKSADGKATVHFRDCRTVTDDEVPPDSVHLMMGPGVYLGKEATWDDYMALYSDIYQDGLIRLREDGYLVMVMTDQYKDGQVIPRNALLLRHLMKWGYTILDTKVWRRRKADFFQPPFSMVWVMTPGTAKRPKGREYLQGIWDYPQLCGGRLNAYPDSICRLIVESFTKPGDFIFDPCAGTGRLLGRAAAMGRTAVGYELDQSLIPVVTENLDPATGWLSQPED